MKKSSKPKNRFELFIEPGTSGEMIRSKVGSWSPLQMTVSAWDPEMEHYRSLMENKAKRNDPDAFNYNAVLMFDLCEQLTVEAVFEVQDEECRRFRTATFMSGSAMAGACLLALLSLFWAAAVCSAVLAGYAFYLFVVYKPRLRTLDECFQFYSRTYPERKSYYLQYSWMRLRGGLRRQRRGSVVKTMHTDEFIWEWTGSPFGLTLQKEGYHGIFQQGLQMLRQRLARYCGNDGEHF